LAFTPRGDKPPRYIYKARQGGLGGFSRLCKCSRGVYPTAGSQQRLNELKQEMPNRKATSSKTYSVHWAFISPSHRGVINHPATFTKPAEAD
ncbi:MAG: hypothetical protein AABZ00_11545, partial [Chloroflexota bacterium]